MNKVCELDEIFPVLKKAQTIMYSGFGGIGNPPLLVKVLADIDLSAVTLIGNDAAFPTIGIGPVIANKKVKKLITSHIGSNPIAGQKMISGELEIEFSPQGILMERIRAGGSGIAAVLSDICYAEALNQPVETMRWQNQDYFIEPALTADVAIIYAKKADRFGNLMYEATARNTAPLMAMAAEQVIVEVEEMVDVGELNPEHIMTPGLFVTHLVQSQGIDWRWAWEA
ncbi:CoA transferase subunit A [Alkalihalobacillus pseudalcaliphilus]|uniref:CoA transferase subunit A n=1 Tax=Alkalihalobacillus pseudalcaliphilus TaxID=79884 RepID=UPI00064DCA74|nr:CoA transferase subunit A [Alkalihalobacillus pseudalcaliphilus]KMK76173.1 CoA-transferase [Alkalihalobacillus pseudalcaliphilus]